MERKEHDRIVDIVIPAIEKLIVQGKLQRRPNGKIPALVSDVDGTVGKLQLLISLLILIGEDYLTCAETVLPLNKAIAAYYRGALAFPEVVSLALKILPKAIKGLPAISIERLTEKVVKTGLERVYQFPQALLNCLATQPPETRRLILSVTGAPQMVADPFCQALNFDVAIGCNYFLDETGHFTGERDETSAIRKDEVLKVLAQDCGIDLDESIGMGDTMSDLPILLAVNIRYRWAINPKPELLAAMRRNPDYNVVCIHDHHSTGVQFFRALSNGCLYEPHRKNFLPPDLVEALPRLPGEYCLFDQPTL
ncbi:MAG: haloacid dehalogenase-like hydrolase [Patescibacteria group bacterium]|jgi:phosphoserine phosphatase